jgi:hypothetical protein
MAVVRLNRTANFSIMGPQRESGGVGTPPYHMVLFTDMAARSYSTYGFQLPSLVSTRTALAVPAAPLFAFQDGFPMPGAEQPKQLQYELCVQACSEQHHAPA